jgi:hypothetical protein
VAVAVLVVGVDAFGLHADLDARGFRLLGVPHHLAGEVGEAAGHFGEEVADLEADAAVGGVDGESLGLGRGNERQRGERGHSDNKGFLHGKPPAVEERAFRRIFCDNNYRPVNGAAAPRQPGQTPFTLWICREDKDLSPGSREG